MLHVRFENYSRIMKNFSFIDEDMPFESTKNQIPR